MPKAAYWCDLIKGTDIGATATNTQLGGANYTVPGKARSIVAVRPKTFSITSTVNQSLLASLSIASKDLGLGPYEVFAPPVGANLGTNVSVYQDRAKWYPANFACGGGEAIDFEGYLEIAHTSHVWMGLDILLSDTQNAEFPGELNWWNKLLDLTKPVQAKIGGIAEGSGPTSTATTAGVASDGGTTVGGANKYIHAVYGVAVDTTPTASQPLDGEFSLNETGLAINPLGYYGESPGAGLLGTTTANQCAHITALECLNIFLKTNAKIVGKFTNDVTLTAAGKFEVGFLYQDE